MSFLMSPELEGIVDLSNVVDSTSDLFFSFSEEQILSLKISMDSNRRTLSLFVLLEKERAKELIESGFYSEIKISNTFSGAKLKIQSIEILHQNLQEYQLKIVCNVIYKEKLHE